MDVTMVDLGVMSETVQDTTGLIAPMEIFMERNSVTVVMMDTGAQMTDDESIVAWTMREVPVRIEAEADHALMIVESGIAIKSELAKE